MNEQERFNQALAELAEEMMSIVMTTPHANDWKEAICDARFAPDGGSRLNKLRIKTNGGRVESAKTSIKISLLLRELWGLRAFCLTNTWYGLKISLRPNGECQTDFSFDPHCTEDPHFFDD